MENQHEDIADLVGGRSDDREGRVIEAVTKDGMPLWMAFLEDPDALVTSKEDIQDAKNALVRAMQEKKDVVEMCQRQPLDECIKELHKAA